MYRKRKQMNSEKKSAGVFTVLLLQFFYRFKKFPK